MKRRFLIFWLAALPVLVSAQDTVDGDYTEAASVGLSKQLLCEVAAVGSGNLALFAGLLVALYGLWTMVRSGSLKSGFILIISGALLTTLPSLIISSLGGVAHWLQASGMSNQGDLFDVPSIIAQARDCSQINVDWSSYTSVPAWKSSFSGDRNIAPGSNPTKINYGAGASGIMDPHATTGSPGCAQLVDGGTPGSPFGPRTSVRTTNGRFSSSNHKGADVRCGGHDGPKIHAGGGGTISYIQFNTGGYGNRIVIDHGNGNSTTYNHMTGFAPGMQMGKSVGGGDVIGYCGHTGNVTGPHLHFELIKQGKFVDPVANGCSG
jgi:hypothetical protein